MDNNQDKDYSHLIALSREWIQEASRVRYFHELTWLGRTIIQVPQDSYAVQELIWAICPDLIIETGIAHGGSLILSASMLALLDYCDAAKKRQVFNPLSSSRKVLGIDIEIRPHNREAIEQHPLSHLITMIEGSSVDTNVIQQVYSIASNYQRILIFLDSNHTHEHVLAELNAYAPLVSPNSYCVVWDTGIEDLPEGFVKDRPWGKGNNPKTAVFEYLNKLKIEPVMANDGKRLHFEIDKTIEYKLAITAAPDGFLKRCIY
jgi:cephalosporin hydroxylase